ncbi:MAG: hypothetical protein AAGE03_11630 [Pseudomonadota bacterium]
MSFVYGALILGAPWGKITQGGQVEGPLPRLGRIVAAVSIAILVGLALAILSADGHWPRWPPWTGWAAVTINAVMMVLNWITPSTAERKLWGPITTMMLVLAVAVHGL